MSSVEVLHFFMIKMSKGIFEDLTGQKFGRLFVIKRVENIGGRPCFLCGCDCGGEKKVKSSKLKDGSVKSCGCLQKETIKAQTKDITGKIFGKLTVIERNGHLLRGKNKTKISAYLCQCICGKTLTVTGSDLRRGHTTSCGCGRAVDDPKTNSAFQIYKKGYNDGDLTFEQFMELTQKKCYYCNSDMTNNHNQFKFVLAAKTSKMNGNFEYNGLDRINSNLPHNFLNLVPCCKICNKAKGKKSINDFKNHIIKSYNYINLENKIENCDVNKYVDLLNNFDDSYNRKSHPAISSALKIFKPRYNDGNLTFEKFLYLTQLKCYYCGELPTNKCNRFVKIASASNYSILNGDFVYNGLDRIDSNLNHDENNLVTACKICNWMKCDMHMNEYKLWIEKVYLNWAKL